MASEKSFYIKNCRERFPAVPIYNSANFEVDQEGYVVVYTDGSCRYNGQPYAKAGLGVYFGPGHQW